MRGGVTRTPASAGGCVRVPARTYYREWHGHTREHLEAVYPAAREGGRRIVWLLGDSSLDNKAWVGHEPKAAALNGYEHVLDPPVSRRDVCYWLNARAAREDAKVACVNCAVEATTLASRRRFFGLRKTLWQQDTFAAAKMQHDDVVAVSIGGNDVALRPTVMTILSMLRLVHASPERICSPDSSDWWPMRHICWLFGRAVERYLEDVLEGAGALPSRCAVCSIYYPCETGDGWASFALRKLRYDTDPAKLQLIIKTIHERAVSKIRLRVRGRHIPVVPVPLSEVLDPKDPDDYVAMVEPSPIGGSKIADRLWDELLGGGGQGAGGRA